MKALFSTVVLFFLALFAGQAFAADTLDVAALPMGNLNNVINGDTLAGGFRAHPDRVYRLKRGSVYQMTEAMKIRGSLKIVATAGTNRPPVLAPAVLPDGSSIGNFFNLVGKGGKVAISDIYLLSVTAEGNQLGWSEALYINADSISLKLRGVIFDAFSSCGIKQFGSWAKIDVQDCKFRNMQHGTSYFGGQPFLSDNMTHIDTCKFINNTFFACNAYIWSIRGYDRFAEFSHNTIAYTIVNPFLARQAYNYRMNNNLFYSVHSLGGTPVHLRQAWFLNYPDTVSTSIIFIRAKTETVDGNLLKGEEALIDSAKGVTAPMVDPINRVIEIKNNAYTFPQKLADTYKAYNDTVTKTDDMYGVAVKRTLTMPRWMNDYTKNNVDNVLPSVSPNTVVTNNIDADPGFNTSIASHIDKVCDYVIKIATDKLDKPWFYNPNNSQYPPAWPLPEDLSYSNVALQSAGTDGYAVGDLNWFPAQKAKYITGVETITTAVPAQYTLDQNYPNPFNPSTMITFSLPKASNVTLKVYNMIGQEVATLVNSQIAAGTHQVNFNASALSSGVYVYRLQAGAVQMTKKMMLIK